MYLIMKRNNRPKPQDSDETEITTVIYDLPIIKHDIDSKATTIQDNVAYGVV